MNHKRDFKRSQLEEYLRWGDTNTPPMRSKGKLTINVILPLLGASSRMGVGEEQRRGEKKDQTQPSTALPSPISVPAFSFVFMTNFVLNGHLKDNFAF